MSEYLKFEIMLLSDKPAEITVYVFQHNTLRESANFLFRGVWPCSYCMWYYILDVKFKGTATNTNSGTLASAIFQSVGITWQDFNSIVPQRCKTQGSRKIKSFRSLFTSQPKPHWIELSQYLSADNTVLNSFPSAKTWKIASFLNPEGNKANRVLVKSYFTDDFCSCRNSWLNPVRRENLIVWVLTCFDHASALAMSDLCSTIVNNMRLSQANHELRFCANGSFSKSRGLSASVSFPFLPPPPPPAPPPSNFALFALFPAGPENLVYLPLPRRLPIDRLTNWLSQSLTHPPRDLLSH